MPKGGKREGTGPKPKEPGNPYTVRLFTLVSEQMAEQLNARRQGKKDSEILREALRLWIGQNKPRQ